MKYICIHDATLADRETGTLSKVVFVFICSFSHVMWYTGWIDIDNNIYTLII